MLIKTPISHPVGITAKKSGKHFIYYFEADVPTEVDDEVGEFLLGISTETYIKLETEQKPEGQELKKQLTVARTKVTNLKKAIEKEPENSELIDKLSIAEIDVQNLEHELAEQSK